MAPKKNRPSSEAAPHIEDDSFLDDLLHESPVGEAQPQEQESRLDEPTTAPKERKPWTRDSSIPSQYLGRFRVPSGPGQSKQKSPQQQLSQREILPKEDSQTASTAPFNQPEAELTFQLDVVTGKASSQLPTVDPRHHENLAPAQSEGDTPTSTHDDERRPAERTPGSLKRPRSPAQEQSRARKTRKQQIAARIADDRAKKLQTIRQAMGAWSPQVLVKLRTLRYFAEEMNSAANTAATAQTTGPSIPHDLTVCFKDDFLAALMALAADLELKQPDAVTYADGEGLVVERNRNDRFSLFDRPDVVHLDWSRKCLLEHLVVQKIGGRKIFRRTLLQIECVMQAYIRRRTLAAGVPSVGFRPNLREAVTGLSEADAADLIKTEWEKAQQKGLLEAEEPLQKMVRESGDDRE